MPDNSLNPMKVGVGLTAGGCALMLLSPCILGLALMLLKWIDGLLGGAL